MKWSVYDLSWARPLKSIIALFNNKIINFNFFHLQSGNLTSLDGADDEIVKKINEILDSKIRPAVARDGGDIKFKSFKDGLVEVELKGSCSGCPSSIMTLKQ